MVTIFRPTGRALAIRQKLSQRLYQVLPGSQTGSPPNRPRYGITFDDHVTPEERALGLASSTIKVIDLQTQAVLGEATQYAWTPGVLFTGPKGPNAKDRWLSAYGCGHPHQETGFLTRLFVDQVLKPLSPHRK
jgi:hypothetical protein